MKSKIVTDPVEQESPDVVTAAIERAYKRLAEMIAAGPTLLLDECEAAQLCGVGVTTFRRCVSAGKLPRMVALTDGLAQWRRKDIEAAVNRLKTRERTKRASTRARLAIYPTDEVQS